MTATTEYFFLLSEYEVFGSIDYANINEADKQAQYSYYSAGNSRVKYHHNATNRVVDWWLRSPYIGNTKAFVLVYTNGLVSGSDATSSRGFAPGFCV